MDESDDGRRRFNVGRSGPLWQEVADSLLTRVVSGEFAEGSTLPGESALAAEYGVSRPSMRDAVKALQQKGLLKIHHGIGSVVQPKEKWSVLDEGIISARLATGDVADQMFDELSIVRIALESEMARLAAQFIDSVGTRQLTKLIDRMEAASDHDDSYLVLDLEFHELVMVLSRCKFALAVMGTIRGPLRQSRRITNKIPDGVRVAQQFHRQIAEYIIAGDADAAARAMREHLTWSWLQYTKANRYPLAVTEVETNPAHFTRPGY